MKKELEDLDSWASKSHILNRGIFPRISDIALWSTIRQLFPDGGINKLPKSVKAVYEMCDKMIMDYELME